MSRSVRPGIPTEQKWDVYVVIDRGEGAKPRLYGGYSNLFSLTRVEAEELAKEERAKSYNKSVEIRPTRHSYGRSL